MKQLILFAFIFLSIGLFSCDKKKEKEEFTLSAGLPSWVKQKVEELSAKTGESCKFIDVLIFETQGKHYYNIAFGYSSCNNCNLFDEKGNPVPQSELGRLPGLKVIDMKQACP
jgi:uncharacterized ParB-like nuclease family protein